MFPLLSRMSSAALAGHLGAVPVPAQGTAEQPAPPAGVLRRLAGPAGRPLARRHRRRRPPHDPARAPRHPAHHARIARGDAGQRQRRPRRRSSPGCRPSSSTRSTPSPATTGAGTCSPCWNASPTSSAGPSNASGSRPPSATRRRCWPGCKARGRGSRPGLRSVGAPTRRSPATGPPPGDIELDYVGTLANAATVIATLHAGEKRLVFCESRQSVEELGELLRGKRHHHLPVARLALRRRTSPLRGGLRRGPRLRHRLHQHPGTRHRRRRPGPGHPDQRTRLRRLVPATTRPHRPAGINHAELPVPRHRQLVAAPRRRRC